MDLKAAGRADEARLSGEDFHRIGQCIGNTRMLQIEAGHRKDVERSGQIEKRGAIERDDADPPGAQHGRTLLG